jgi:hypothetical protein
MISAVRITGAVMASLSSNVHIIYAIHGNIASYFSFLNHVNYTAYTICNTTGRADKTSILEVFFLVPHNL